MNSDISPETIDMLFKAAFNKQQDMITEIEKKFERELETYGPKMHDAIFAGILRAFLTRCVASDLARRDMDVKLVTPWLYDQWKRVVVQIAADYVKQRPTFQ